jgi:aminopeptidase YwaD
MRRALTLVLLSGAVLAAQTPARITPSSFLAHVRYLASDEMGGRGNGTATLGQAAHYIATAFRKAGLRGGGVNGDFFQPFDAEVRIEPPATAAVTLGTPTGIQSFALGRDYYPLSVRDRLTPPGGVRDTPVVFAGYGISAPGLGYDDYEGVDVRGAAVLVFTHEPQEADERSRFDGRSLTPAAAISAKAREARERGARLLMVVEDPGHLEDRTRRGAWWTDPQSEAMGMPVVRLARDRLTRALPTLELTRLAALIDDTLTPQSQRLDGVSVSYDDQRAQFTASLSNVLGILPGADPSLAGEAIVVGAHYDHVGTGGQYSEAPEATGQIHNGADDNASGTAALLEMARVAAASRARFGRTIVFASFAGEELGLLGSERYVAEPVMPLERTVAMINLDMIGRARGRVMVGVFGRASSLSSLIRNLPTWTRLSLEDFSRGGYAQDESDVASFALRGVPAVAFFTGFHADYHRPSDDWARIDAEGGAEIARLALRLVEGLSRQNASAGR